MPFTMIVQEAPTIELECEWAQSLPPRLVIAADGELFTLEAVIDEEARHYRYKRATVCDLR